MTNPTTAVPVCTATHQNAPQQQPAAAKPALPEPMEAIDFLERVESIGIHWWSTISSVLESHRHHDHIHPAPIEPLPQWAADRLNDHGQHESSEAEFTQQVKLLAEAVRLSAGDGSNYRYEVWTTRASRLAIKHMSWEEAATVVDRLKGQFPDAFVARVHVKSSSSSTSDPALLDTLIGQIEHTGTTFRRAEEDLFAVRDETGREVTVKASVLRAHALYPRLSNEGKEAIEHYLQRLTQRGQTASAADTQGEQHAN
jgi:hypothetical protein